jgi:CspA family cold shock protein
MNGTHRVRKSESVLRNEDKSVFVHHSAISESGLTTLGEGDRVTFDVEQDAKGASAMNVTEL